MRFQLASPEYYPRNLNLPWATPLEDWPGELFIDVAVGIHRHVVRFICHEGAIFAIKEIVEHIGMREYRLLRELYEDGLPAVEPVGLVLERQHRTALAIGEHTDMALLVTRYLDLALPYRNVISGGANLRQVDSMLDALAELLVRLHLVGFFWGDVSLSNVLFRRDAGKLAAYVVDAETAEKHDELSNGQRHFDLQVAEENLAGELMDVDAGYGLPDGLDPVELAQSLAPRYEALWTELTRVEVFSTQEQYRVQARIERLNKLGFDVEELEFDAIAGGHSLRMRAKVVEPGHHRRRLQSLTGLPVEENQARRLLNDIERYRAWVSGIEERELPMSAAAHRWRRDVYESTLERIEPALRNGLDDAEVFHEVLEHRWYMSEAAGHDVGLDESVASYVADILAPAADTDSA